MTGAAPMEIAAPVIAARTELMVPKEIPEATCRETWAWIEVILNVWKFEHGTHPKDQGPLSHGLLGNVWAWAGIDDKDIPAYAWTGRFGDTYAHLIDRLITSNYEPFADITKTVPGNILWAVITLAEAAQGSVAGAVFAYSELMRLRVAEAWAWGDVMAKALDAAIPGAAKAARFKPGRAGKSDQLGKLIKLVMESQPDISDKEAWRQILKIAPTGINLREDADGALTWNGSSRSVDTQAFSKRMTRARRERTKPDR